MMYFLFKTERLLLGCLGTEGCAHLAPVASAMADADADADIAALRAEIEVTRNPYPKTLNTQKPENGKIPKPLLNFTKPLCPKPEVTRAQLQAETAKNEERRAQLAEATARQKPRVLGFRGLGV